MRGDRYKLLRYRGTEELYDLERYPYEYNFNGNFRPKADVLTYILGGRSYIEWD